MTAIEQIRRASRRDARERTVRTERPRWPMIVLKSPKGWTGPKIVDGKRDRRYIPFPPGTPVGSG